MECEKCGKETGADWKKLCFGCYTKARMVGTGTPEENVKRQREEAKRKRKEEKGGETNE